MLVGHLLCGVIFGTLLGTACLGVGLPVTSAVAALVISANVGLGASL